MKNLILVLFVITSVLFLKSCEKSTTVIEGRLISIDYGSVEEINDKSWIKIDNHKFVHLNSPQTTNEEVKILPTTLIKVESPDRENNISINTRTITRYLANHLTNTRDLDDKYVIIDRHLISLKGVIKFAKIDSTKIRIEFPENYPGKIRTFSFGSN